MSNSTKASKRTTNKASKAKPVQAPIVADASKGAAVVEAAVVVGKRNATPIATIVARQTAHDANTGLTVREFRLFRLLATYGTFTPAKGKRIAAYVQTNPLLRDIVETICDGAVTATIGAYSSRVTNPDTGAITYGVQGGRALRLGWVIAQPANACANAIGRKGHAAFSLSLAGYERYIAACPGAMHVADTESLAALAAKACSK
jgi:hypothetical protein